MARNDQNLDRFRQICIEKVKIPTASVKSLTEFIKTLTDRSTEFGQHFDAAVTKAPLLNLYKRNKSETAINISYDNFVRHKEHFPICWKNMARPQEQQILNHVQKAC